MQIEVVPATGNVSGAVAGLSSVVPAPMLARWDRSGGIQVGSLVLARDGGEIVAAAYEVHRPLTAYRKVVDVWADSDEAAQAVLDEIETRAWREGALVVKRDLPAPAGPDAGLGTDPGADPGADLGRDADEPGGARADLGEGYVEVPRPVWGGPVAGPHHRPVASGRARWASGSAPGDVPYMRQTTDFTCGPVALQMGLAALGLAGEPTRETEMRLWRRANTVMGCDPLGLAAAAADAGSHPVTYLSSEGPTLLELCRDDEEKDLRGFLQREFRAELAERGLPVHTEVFELDTLRDALDAGGVALVLIEERGMHAESSPHWITVHGRIGDEFFLANDPWTDADLGETFVDATNLPLPAATLDRLAWYGSPAYRAMVVLTAPTA